MFRKIFVAFDGSPHAFKALNLAIALAQRFEGSLHLATAVNLPELPDDVRLESDHLSGKRSPYQLDLEKATRIAAHEEIPVSTHLLRGHAAQTLINFIEKNDFDIVVIGARGKNISLKAPMGTVATHLINHLDCPVLVVREKS